MLFRHIVIQHIKHLRSVETKKNIIKVNLFMIKIKDNDNIKCFNLYFNFKISNKCNKMIKLYIICDTLILLFYKIIIILTTITYKSNRLISLY